ncbi:MAG TPA: DedA family protein [Lacunisphaera sp.]|nr:DedA family protein [Lacunisphaera sp.]
MFDTLLKHFQDSPLSLWGPFIVLILCGLGLPVPEDIVLVSAGVLAQIDDREWYSVAALMYGGVMLGDSTIFLAGRYFGARMRASRWFQRYFSQKKQDKVEDLFHRYHSWVLFVGRFLPGLRAPIFFTAGSTRVKYWKFFFFDGLAALISVPFFVWLGFWLWEKFGNDIAALKRALSRTHSYSIMVAALIGLVLVLAIFRIVRKSRVKWDE